MDTRIYLVTLTLFAFFLCTNTAPIPSEGTEDFPLDRECLYQTQYYPHGSSIETEEPCLNCTCNKGVLVCFLRVCHNLVAPQDSDCELRKSEGQCCAELVCGVKNIGSTVGNTTQSADVTTPKPRLSDEPLESNERASEDITLSPAEFTVPDNAAESGCQHKGSVYAEGSAMPSSAFCEYCYCIKGHQRCIRPQCHLHIDECKPIYRHDFSCCPTAYRCSKRVLDFTSTSSTTTAISVQKLKRQDCHVNGTLHKEGDVVFSEDICQNCFCVKGEVRCSTTTCALNLESCQPIIQPGKCCPTGYNCTVPATTEAPQEQDASLTGSTTDSAITFYFDNTISSTDTSIAETLENAYESRTSMDTLPINDTDSANDTTASRDNDRNILEVDVLVVTTAAAEEASSEASELVSSTPESTESTEISETTTREGEIASLDTDGNEMIHTETTSEQSAEAGASSSSSLAAEENLIGSNITDDIAVVRTYAADAVDTTTTLSVISHSLNSSVKEDELATDNILQSKAAVTEFILPQVHETVAEAETNSTDDYTFKNASEAATSFQDEKIHINATAVNVTEIDSLNDEANETASMEDKKAGFASNSSDFEVKVTYTHDSTENVISDVGFDPSNANNTNHIFDDTSYVNISTTETAIPDENTIQNWNFSSTESAIENTSLDDSVDNQSVIERADVDGNVTRVDTESQNEIVAPNALYGGIHIGNNPNANTSNITYQNDLNLATSNVSDINSTNLDTEILEATAIGIEEYSNNETSIDVQFHGKNKNETTLLHNLNDTVPSEEHQDNNLANATEAVKGYGVEENQTNIVDVFKSHNVTAISENATEVMKNTALLYLTYKTPPNMDDNGTSSQFVDTEESNITEGFVDNAANEAVYRQAVKSSSNISSFENESVPIVHLSHNSSQKLSTTDKVTLADNSNYENSVNITEISADQLQDPYEAQASNETLVIKPGPVSSNRTNTLLGSFSSIVSSLLQQEDSGISTTAQAELIHSKLPESFDVLLEDLVGEYPGEVQFNTISYLNFSNNAATVSTTTVSQDSITHPPEPEVIPSNETQQIEESEGTSGLNDSHEAPNQLEELSGFFLKNSTTEDNPIVKYDKNDSKTIENTNGIKNISQHSSSQEVSPSVNQHKDTTADTTESQTKLLLLDANLEAKGSETEIKPSSYNQSIFEETTSGDMSNSGHNSQDCNRTNDCNLYNTSSTYSQSNQASDRDPDEKIIAFTKSGIEESTTENEMHASTTTETLNTTYRSAIDNDDNEQVFNLNASTAQPDTHQSTASTSMLLTTLNSNVAEDISTPAVINNPEVISFDIFPGQQVNPSNSTTVMEPSNETLQVANDSLVQDLPWTSSPPAEPSAPTTHKPDQADEPTAVGNQNEFQYHDIGFDTSIDDPMMLPRINTTLVEKHEVTENGEQEPETTTIAEDLDDTLEMILNLSKTYAITHPRPSFGDSQNKTDEELLSGTLPSEIEAKIAEIIRQAQAGLIHGQAPLLHFNGSTAPHFAYDESDVKNATADVSDYDYDAGNESGESQSLVPSELLAHIGGLFNSSWSSQISGDVHRDQFEDPAEASKDPQDRTPSNESIVNDLHQMFIPLVELTKMFNETALVTPVDDQKFPDASTLLPNDVPPTQPSSTSSSHVEIELATLFSTEAIEEVGRRNETQSSDAESLNEESLGSSVIGADHGHHQHTSTETSTHSIHHQPEAHTTDRNIDDSDPWQQHGGSHFAHDNDDSYKDHAADGHQTFEDVQGHSDIEDVFSHAVAADDDEKSYFSADDFETGASPHEVENSGEVSAADSKLSADGVGIKEVAEHNDALLESTHLHDESGAVADWQADTDSPAHQFQYDESQSELFEAVPQPTAVDDVKRITKEVPQRFPSTSPSNDQDVEASLHEETEALGVVEAIAEPTTTITVSEIRTTERITEPRTTTAVAESAGAIQETTNAETATRVLTTKAAPDGATAEAVPEAAETSPQQKEEDSFEDTWLDLQDDGISKPTDRNTIEHFTTTASSVPSDPATNFFSTLSNFFSQAIANAGLHQNPQDKAGSTDVPESDGHQSSSGSHHVAPAQHDQHRGTAVQDTKPGEDHSFPEAGFLRKDAGSSGHHFLATEATSSETRNPQHQHPGRESLHQPAQASDQHSSESNPLLPSFENPDPQGDYQHPISGAQAPEVYESAFVASEVITTPDPNAFVGLVSKGSIVFENVLPLSRRGRPTTDERTGQALPTPRKSSSIDNGSTEESALAPEDVRVIPFLPEDAITDELHQEPVKPNLAPRNEDRDAIVVSGELVPITVTPLAQDTSSMTVRVSATSSLQVDDVAGHDETGSVGVAVPISPDGEEFVPVTVTTPRTTSSAPTKTSSHTQGNSPASTTPQLPSAVTEARVDVASSTLHMTDPTTSPTGHPMFLSVDAAGEDSDYVLEHHLTGPTQEVTPRAQSTRTNKNDDQGLAQASSFQQTPDYCVEEGEVFQDGERIPTLDFCAQCRCNRGEIQCQHVSCPQRPPGCIEKVMPSSCCPAFLCNETGLIQDGESGLPLRSGITIHGGFVPIERPMIPPEHLEPSSDVTQRHAEVPSAGEIHGPENSQSHHGTQVTKAGSHMFGSEVDTAPVGQTEAPRTPEPKQEPHTNPVNEGAQRVSTTESFGIFDGLLESVFGGEVTQGLPAGPGAQETIEEAKGPEPQPEGHDTDRTGHDEESEVLLTTSTSGPTTTKPTSRHTTEASRSTEGTSTKATEAPVGMWPMLKVSSCNIYGRVYQVGSKIGVLSGPCKECKCTSGGVECYRIKCF